MNDPLAELASLYVLDQLNEHDRTAFAARLLREPELAALVRDLEAGLSHGVRSLPQTQPPAEMLDRIERQIGATEVPAEPAPSAGSAIHWLSFAKWGIAAVIAVSLGILAVQSLRRSSAQPMIVVVGLDANRNTFADLPLSSTKDPDARFIQLASLAENFWQKPGDLPANAKPAADGNRGYALFDPASQQGFIAIEELAPITATQRYHLWVIDPASGQIHDAGILPLSGMSRGLYSFTLAPGDAPKSTHPQFFVTIEESNASTQPSAPRGKVVLGKQRI